MSVLAFDLGGTRLKAGVAGDGPRPARVEILPAPPAGELLAVLGEVGAKLLDGEQAEGVGLCVPGVIAGGRVVALPGKHPGIAGIDLGGALGEAFDARAVVVNDAIAAGVGEARAGAGRGASRVVVVTIGTGVGVCALQDGEPLGAGPFGGGILGGQIPVAADTGAGTDTSGRAGTIEALCRAERIVALAGADFGTVHEVYAAHAGGDPAATRAITVYRGNLVRALVALANAHAPERIVLGGGPITGTDPVMPGLTEELAPHLFAGLRVEVVGAALGEAVGLTGLALLVREGR